MPISCPICGTEFEPRDARQKCCSKACGTKRYEKTPHRRALELALYRKHRDKRREAANRRYDQDAEYRERVKAQTAKRRLDKADEIAQKKAAYMSRPENREHAARKTREWREDHPEWAARIDAERPLRGNRRKKTAPETP